MDINRSGSRTYRGTKTVLSGDVKIDDVGGDSKSITIRYKGVRDDEKNTYDYEVRLTMDDVMVLLTYLANGEGVGDRFLSDSLSKHTTTLLTLLVRATGLLPEGTNVPRQ